MARHQEGPKLHRRPGRKVYSVRFTHRGRGVELSTKSADREVAESNGWAIYERVTGGVRYLRPRGLTLPAFRALGVVPVVLPPAASGLYVAWCPLLPGFVKIGWSSNIRRRLRHLGTGLPAPLYPLALEPGGPNIEAAAHRRFAGLRRRGEWFEAASPILGFVAGIRGRCQIESGTLGR